MSVNDGGEADIHACYRGRYLGVEVKRPGEEPGKRQANEAEELRDIGGFSIVPIDVETTMAALIDIDAQILIREMV